MVWCGYIHVYSLDTYRGEGGREGGKRRQGTVVMWGVIFGYGRGLWWVRENERWGGPEDLAVSGCKGDVMAYVEEREPVE